MTIMDRDGPSGVQRAALMAIAVVVAGQFLGRTVTLDARSDWELFATGVRQSGRDSPWAGEGHVRLRVPDLRPADTVVLELAARPVVGSLTVEVARGQSRFGRFAVGTAPVSVSVGPGSDSEILLDVVDADDSGRFLYHLLKIEVVRSGVRGWLVPLLPALASASVFLVVWGHRGRWLALLYALGVAFLTLALTIDPLVAARTPSLKGWAQGCALALVLAVVLMEPLLRLLPRIAVSAGLVLFAGVHSHLPGLNGPSYWQWTWQEANGRALYSSLVPVLLFFFLARAVHQAGKVRVGFALGLVSACVLLTETAAMSVQPSGLDRMHAVIAHPIVTSYYADARELVTKPDWLRRFPESLEETLQGHSLTKPPGPIAFYVALIRFFGDGPVSTTLAALLIAFGSALAVPAVYLLATQFNELPEAAFEAASVMALAPALTLFFPQLDQAFPLVTCALLASWHRAVRGSGKAAVACGLCVFGASFFSYSFLVLGVAGLVIAASDPRRAFQAALRAGVVAAIAYGVLFLTTGFDPAATFRAAFSNQSRLAVGLDRAWLPAVLLDPFDFAMGAGWLAFLLAAVTVARGQEAGQADRPATLAVFQILSVDLSGLLRVEAARVWLFLTPLVAIPAGRELSRWTRIEQNCVYVVMALLLATLAQNMKFNGAGPGLGP